MIGRVHRLSMATAVVVLAVMAFVAVAPANRAGAQGETKTETIALEPFSSIQINGGGSATLTFGDAPSVTITGNSLIVDQLDARDAAGCAGLRRERPRITGLLDYCRRAAWSDAANIALGYRRLFSD